MAPVNADGTVVPASVAPSRDRATDRQLELLASEVAGRVIRKETQAIRRAAARTASDPDGFKAWLGEFYDGHAQFVVETLHVSDGQARAYCQEQHDDVAWGGVNAIENWHEARIPRLVEMALSAGGEPEDDD